MFGKQSDIVLIEQLYKSETVTYSLTNVMKLVYVAIVVAGPAAVAVDVSWRNQLAYCRCHQINLTPTMELKGQN